MTERAISHWAGTWQLALAVGRGHLRDRRGLLVSLLTPLGMLLIFWITLRHVPEVLHSLMPSVVGIGVMLAGSAEATRVTSWREQGVLARLACTPIPLLQVLLAGAGAQAVIGAAQGVVILLAGIWLLGLRIDGIAAAGTLLTVVLGSVCFTAYGALVAQAANRAESANALFVFSILPMYLVGGGMPFMPEWVARVGAWLPTGLLVQAIAGFLGGITVVAPPPVLLAGLAGYTLLFSAVAARYFRLS